MLRSAILPHGVQMVSDMTGEETQGDKNDPVIREIIELERSYFFEKRNVKTERQRKLREIIERHTKAGDIADDS